MKKNSNEKKRKRSWKKFGIRTLFVLITFFALVFGFWVYPSLQQKRIVKNLTDLGYLVRYDIASEMPAGRLQEFIRGRMGKDFLYDVHSVTMFSEEDGHAKSDDMEEIGKLNGLRELSLYSGELKRGDLKHLRDMKSLWRLEILVSGITDDDLSDISELDLGKINLGDLPITDHGVEHLAGMSSLTMLKLDGTNITDEAIRSFENLPHLEWLGLRGTKISDDGLKRIADAQSLDAITTLMLYSTSVSTNGIKHLPGLPNLTYLDLENTKVDDDALPYIAKLKNLTTLYLSFTQVTADEINKLDLPKLTRLELRATKISTKDVVDFQKRHPKCSIDF